MDEMERSKMKRRGREKVLGGVVEEVCYGQGSLSINWMDRIKGPNEK